MRIERVVLVLISITDIFLKAAFQFYNICPYVFPNIFIEQIAGYLPENLLQVVLRRAEKGILSDRQLGCANAFPRTD